MMEYLPVIIVATSDDVRLRLQRLVDEQPGFNVVSMCEDDADALQLIRKLKPDDIVMDIGSSDMEEFQMVDSFQRATRPVVILLADDGREAARAYDLGDRIALKQGTGYVFLNLDEIDWIQAADTYVRFHTDGKSYMIRERLKHVEHRLARKGFLRIHRSTIVNLNRIREVLSESNGGAHVVLKTGTKLKISRSYLKDLETLLAPLQLG